MSTPNGWTLCKFERFKKEISNLKATNQPKKRRRRRRRRRRLQTISKETDLEIKNIED
jgi:hypothetical protein